MGATQGWSEAYEVHVGINCADEAALKACVAYFDFGIFVEDVFVDLYHLGYYGAVKVGLP